MNTQNIEITTKVYNVVAKIDQLLRLYIMVKKTDSSKRSIVQKKVNQLLNSIKNEQIYFQIQHSISKTIKTCLQQVKQVSKQKIESISSIKSVSQYISVEKSSQKFVELSIIKNLVSSQQVSKGKLNSFESINSLNLLQVNKPEPQKMSVGSQEFEMSCEKSQQSSINQNNLELLRNQFDRKQGKAHKMFAINQDIFNHLKDNDQNTVLLFGVNQPQKKNIEKTLYMCTLMKFSSFQVLSHNVTGQSRFTRQCKLFQNNLRASLGIIILGNSIESIQIQHLKFLLELNCVSYIIIVMQSFKQRNGTLYQFNNDTMIAVRDLNKIQYQAKLNQLKEQYGNKGVSLSTIEVVKEKFVITKNLARTITNYVENAKNAIQIQTKNQCIKEEPNKFSYKFTTKFVAGGGKSDFQIFFLQNQVLLYRMSFDKNGLQSFSHQVQEAPERGKFVLSTLVVKQSTELKKQFMKILLKSKARDPFFLFHYSGISIKKSLVLTMKNGISESDIDNGSPLTLKELEKDNWFSNLILIIDKKNAKQYQTDSKTQLTDYKKK